MSIDCYCDYDPPEVYSSRIVRGRKLYSCYECGKPIAIGETHEYVFAVWGGYPGSPRTCMSCVGIRNFVKTNIPCFCWGHGNLIEDCRNTIEAAYDAARDEVQGLAFGFGRLLVKAKRARAHDDRTPAQRLMGEPIRERSALWAKKREEA